MGTDHKRYIRFLLPLFLLFLFAGPVKVPAATEAEQQVFDFLTGEMSLPPAAACGIMGTIKAESNFIPDIYGGGGAYGICQWMNVRVARLQSYCSSNGYDHRTLEGQLHFLQYEVNEYFPDLLKYLKSVDNTAEGTYQAGYKWCADFERPGNVERDSSYRASIGRDTYWPMLGNKAVYLTGKLSAGGVDLSWQVNGTHTLALKRSLSRKGNYHTLVQKKSGAGTYLDTSAEPGTTYYYVVRLLSDTGKVTESSNIVRVTTPKSVSDSNCSISLSGSAFRYDGKAQTPAVTVTYAGAALTENTDYVVSYKDNLNAGKATVTVSGRGDYEGEKELSFEILKADQKLKVKNRIIAWRTNRVKLNIQAEGDIRLVSRNSSVVKGKGKVLLLKGVGETKVVVKAKAVKNYKAASATMTVTVIPPKPEITFAKSRKAGKITLKWKSLKKAAGYQIQYSRKASFASGVRRASSGSTRIVLKGLSRKKTWYFRVRSWRKAGGKRWYSRWSDTVSAVIR